MGESWTITATGKRVDLWRPRPEQIDPWDLADHLSKEQRWVGASQQFISVAQHSVLVAGICADPLAGLLHDAHEAYTGDIPRPVKRLIDRHLLPLELRLDDAICRRFGLLPGSLRTEAVKAADERVMATEVFWLVPQLSKVWRSGVEPLDMDGIPYWPPGYAKATFVAMLQSLLEQAGRPELFRSPPQPLREECGVGEAMQPWIL